MLWRSSCGDRESRMALVFCNIIVMAGIHLAHSFDLGPLILHPASRIPAGQGYLSSLYLL